MDKKKFIARHRDSTQEQGLHTKGGLITFPGQLGKGRGDGRRGEAAPGSRGGWGGIFN